MTGGKSDAAIPYGRQSIADSDVEAVVEALRAPFLTQGPTVGEFERALAKAVGSKFAVAVNSGTAALHCAYAAVGVGPGVTVVTSPISFVATANAALYLGGTVEFVDCDPDTGLMSVDALRALRARAGSVVAPVHLAGHPAEMAEIHSISEERGWKIVEDAAHALGASYAVRGEGYPIGSCAHSDLCEFSFHPVKHITTGEGGAVTTNSEQHYRAMLRFRSHGITRAADEMRRDEGAWYYEQHDLGFNYRITDFQCALGLSQLRRLNDFVERRRVIARRYRAGLADITGLTLPIETAGARSSYHLFPIRVPPDSRRRIFDALRARGVMVNVHYIPIHRQPFYEDRFGVRSLPGAEAYYSSVISLPMFPDLDEETQDGVVSAVREAVS